MPEEDSCRARRHLIHPPATATDAEIPMLRALYDWTMSQAQHRHAIWALAIVAFVESSVFPIPPDVLLIPMILAARERAFRIAAICTVASVLGGFAGYAIGFSLFEIAGRPILEFYSAMAKFEEFRGLYNEWGAWIVLMGGLTPFPYKVITIASGVTQLDPVVFGVASVVARGLRFFLVAALLWFIGPPIRAWLENNLALATTLFFVLLIGGFVALKLIAG